MLLKSQELIQLFSVWATLIPIVVCILIYKKGSLDIRLFFLFLVIGFITDVSMYGLKKAGNNQYQETFSTIYALVEASFFYWMMRRNINLKFKSTLGILYLITFLYWIGLTFVWLNFAPSNFTVSQYFVPIYEVPISFISGFILLQMVEKENSVSDKPLFWIILGVFFYCFCTFFIASLLNTQLSLNIWFLHNIFNIITYGFYTVGLWKYYKIQKTNPKKKET